MYIHKYIYIYIHICVRNVTCSGKCFRRRTVAGVQCVPHDFIQRSLVLQADDVCSGTYYRPLPSIAIVSCKIRCDASSHGRQVMVCYRRHRRGGCTEVTILIRSPVQQRVRLLSCDAVQLHCFGRGEVPTRVVPIASVQ